MAEKSEHWDLDVVQLNDSCEMVDHLNYILSKTQQFRCNSLANIYLN